MATPAPLWSVPLSRNDIPADGRTFDLAAGESVRRAVAAALGLVDLPRLEATFEVRHAAGDGIAVSGRVSASVVQTCVVTLDPFPAEVEEGVDVAFAAEDRLRATPEIDVDAVEADPPDPLVDGRIDLGAIAVEFFQLGLDPYPRKPGVAFDPPAADAAEPGPFAALAALRKPAADQE